MKDWISLTMKALLDWSNLAFRALLTGIACTVLLSACTPQPQPISISIHVWPGYEPLALAHAIGWLDEKQVKLIQVPAFSDTIKLFEEGKVDAAGLTLDEVLHLREKGIPVSVILVCDISAGADMLLARSDIKTLHEIKGHRIAVEDGALGALMQYQVLQAAGLKLEQITPVAIPIDKQVNAWKQGKIDAAISYEPASSELMQLGGKKLFDSRQIPNLIFDVIAVRTSVLDEAHSAALRHLVATHLKGLKHINTNPDDATYRMAPRFKLPPEQVMSTFKGLVLPDLDNNIRLLNSATPAMLKSAETVAGIMHKANILHQQANLNGLLRPEYLPRQE